MSLDRYIAAQTIESTVETCAWDGSALYHVQCIQFSVRSSVAFCTRDVVNQAAERAVCTSTDSAMRSIIGWY